MEPVTLMCDKGCGRGIIYLKSDMQDGATLPGYKGVGRLVGFRCLPCRAAETVAKLTPAKLAALAKARATQKAKTKTEAA